MLVVYRPYQLYWHDKNYADAIAYAQARCWKGYKAALLMSTTPTLQLATERVGYLYRALVVALKPSLHIPCDHL